MQGSIRNTFLFFLLLFLLLLVWLTYIQVWAAPGLSRNPRNTRALEQQMRIERGEILTADGLPLVVNRREGPYYLRDYPQGSLASPWLGYAHPRYGLAGLEAAYNPELSGEADASVLDNFVDTVLGREKSGADLVLTIDSAVQRAAETTLGDRVGAVVALDPATGAVLAMASSPRYDPRLLSQAWERLSTDEGGPLLNRGTRGLYPPGSVFKILVAGAVATDGSIMRPFLVQRVVASSGVTLSEARPSVWKHPVSAETALTLRGMMREAVVSGTGTAAAISGVQVAGKTGTAEVADGLPHAWFVGFAPVEAPQVVVAAVVEHGGTGGKVAAPIVRTVIQAALNR